MWFFLSKLAKGKNKEILNRIRNDELKHYQMWREISGQDVNINWLKVFYYSLLALIFGVTFTIKLMEKGEQSAELAYKGIASQYAQAEAIYKYRGRETVLLRFHCFGFERCAG